jgi:hypothetical protein
MKYLIRQEQKAALCRALSKIGKANLTGIVGLTEKEMQAWMDKVPLYESPADLNVVNPIGQSPLATGMDVPEPRVEKEVVERGKLIRLLRRTVHDPNLWTAGKWEKDTPEYRTALQKVVVEYNSDVDMAAKWVYSIDEREIQDDENY